jgi:hypothetical protein
MMKKLTSAGLFIAFCFLINACGPKISLADSKKAAFVGFK